jgi:hypothetical protein
MYLMYIKLDVGMTVISTSGGAGEEEPYFCIPFQGQGRQVNPSSQSTSQLRF